MIISKTLLSMRLLEHFRRIGRHPREGGDPGFTATINSLDSRLRGNGEKGKKCIADCLRNFLLNGFLKHTMINRLQCSCLLLIMLPAMVFAQENGLGEINLGTTVEGNRELPKILYIIPWATPPGPGQVDPLVPHSANVFERTYSPIERLEQQRRLRYYDEFGDKLGLQ